MTHLDPNEPNVDLSLDDEWVPFTPREQLLALLVLFAALATFVALAWWGIGHA